MTRAQQPPSLSPVRVVIADDHPIWLSGISQDLGPNFDVVGTAGDATETIELVEKLKPDLVVCDLRMPNGGGARVAQQCCATTHVVILTVSEAERDLLDAIAAGALGYLLKSSSAKELREALWKASRAEPVFSPSLAALVIGEFRRLNQAATSQTLSAREREVLQLVARGHRYREIADELSISEKTVENHVRNTLDKLRLTRREELIRYAVKHELD